MLKLSIRQQERKQVELITVKFYSEEQMKGIREEFEEEMLQHPNLSTKKMVGCPCYKAGEKLFVF